MAFNSANTTSGASSRLEREDRDPTLTNSETAADVDMSDAGDDRETLKSEMKALWAEREVVDMTLPFRGIADRGANTSAVPHPVALDDSAEVRELQAKNTSLQKKIDQLTAERFASVETAKKNAEDAKFFQARSENLEYELGEARTRVAAAETERDRLQTDIIRVINDWSSRSDSRAQDASLVHQLMAENAQLKEGKKNTENTLTELIDGLAYYVTYLDIAETGLQVFNCTHEGCKQIPDGQSFSTQLTAGSAAEEFFEAWCKNKDFIKQYNEWRQDCLSHHRAHERANEGHGVASWRLEEVFRALDEKRGVNVTYK